MRRRRWPLRQARLWVADRDVLTKLFSDVAPRFVERQGGYTRILKLGHRPGDNAPLSIIELVEADDVPASADQPEEAAAAE